MEAASELLAIVQAFVNAVMNVFNALKEMFGALGSTEQPTE